MEEGGCSESDERRVDNDDIDVEATEDSLDRGFSRTSICSSSGRFLLRDIAGAEVLIEDRDAAAALLLEVGACIVVVGEGGSR